MELKNVLKGPVITEKSLQDTAGGKFTFRVDRRATKTQVAQAVKRFFQVTPVSVAIMNVKGKSRWVRGQRKKTFLPAWKKAVVTLKEGEKIDVFETEG